jgi:flavodoxin I
MAHIVGDALSRGGVSVEVRNVFEVRPPTLTDYDLVVLGSSTWADGDLQSDFLAFERGMDELDLAGAPVAVFGPGDNRFPHFCEAVDILEAKVKSCNGRLLIPSLKVDTLGGNLEDETEAWAAELAHAAAGEDGEAT